ncbi:hypothetical protein BX600DRAFT_507819 [Xylariales sp. PMI_506]|nr:hypothetical protein BX600DRAFT_507819 [Xylariales sp. PMI_506]
MSIFTEIPVLRHSRPRRSELYNDFPEVDPLSQFSDLEVAGLSRVPTQSPGTPTPNTITMADESGLSEESQSKMEPELEPEVEDSHGITGRRWWRKHKILLLCVLLVVVGIGSGGAASAITILENKKNAGAGAFAQESSAGLTSSTSTAPASPVTPASTGASSTSRPASTAQPTNDVILGITRTGSNRTDTWLAWLVRGQSQSVDGCAFTQVAPAGADACLKPFNLADNVSYTVVCSGEGAGPPHMEYGFWGQVLGPCTSLQRYLLCGNETFDTVLICGRDVGNSSGTATTAAGSSSLAAMAAGATSDSAASSHDKETRWMWRRSRLV